MKLDPPSDPPVPGFNETSPYCAPQFEPFLTVIQSIAHAAASVACAARTRVTEREKCLHLTDKDVVSAFTHNERVSSSRTNNRGPPRVCPMTGHSAPRMEAIPSPDLVASSTADQPIKTDALPCAVMSRALCFVCSTRRVDPDTREHACNEANAIVKRSLSYHNILDHE